MDNLFVQAISQLRQKALSEMIENLISALRMQGYELEEILEGFIEYAQSREDWHEVVAHLKATRNSIIEAKEQMIKNNLS
ncbi:hypothetical protein G7B40_040110 [Aetokthonos hydrillicola Thurmond2011]|jgi:hypothetical protein|uniref:Uncharacterized protein n=1 Tax=Aetokthonos hydrillicola Thurmond2011 TaxID=2712845 RepID=A0AAP5MEB8_9CYAN|nr:hypothetical protein [Aetokthonos hydrillicola]MBO3459934.1 hypothetical protein [Aetokthonos hydrillicola CCALA 1050]MBW4584052.1 hypothetical protein [Aetokthonos hydrillicola CCALA 1050]MDR9900694.1 hypothetical protein [Aetokthonos hydrillicola Thurmond2011]